MSGTQPVGVYAMKVPPGDIMVPACPEFAAMFRVSMAAIDPSADPDIQDDDEKKAPRATLKIIRFPSDMFTEDSDEDDEDYDDDDEDDSEDLEEDDELVKALEADSDEESDDDEMNGGPSDPKKSKRQALLDLVMADEAEEDEDEDKDEDYEDDEEAHATLKKIMKGKRKAADEKEDSDIENEDEALEMDEVVLCTLDPEKHYQQPLDFVVQEDERIFFKVSGTHTVHLTGNYVIPLDDGQTSLYDEDDENEAYDLSPDEDELDALEDEDEESDELDDLADPRFTEVDSEDDAPKLVQAATGKGKNKRPAEDSDVENEEPATLDEVMAKSLKPEETTPIANGESKKLSKSERKRLKKMKKNDGEALPVASAATITPAKSEPTAKVTEPKKDLPSTNGTGPEKKVQFAKNLEQGPTPSATAKPAENKQDTSKKAGLGVRDVQGVTVDDRKVGSGKEAKKGSRLEMRYIGKLENGKQFDANKAGPPFKVKLGEGAVIKGWDIGLMGIQAGGERRLTIPAHLAYGKKGAPPDIPANAKLIFDVKCLAVN